MQPAVKLLTLAALLVAAASVSAQGPWHYQNKADMPPGVIGLRQLQRGGPLAGYFQPVEVTAPTGSLVSVVGEGEFAEPRPTKLMAGMLIGQVYRLKVSNLPGREGQEIFPTIEVIDRLYPPPGQAARFPIPIVLTDEEVNLALDGRYVLRVIYVEEPRTAIPIAETPEQQRITEVALGHDAMETADRLGRPVAILRMGSRVPLPDEDQSRFLYQHPPVLPLEVPPPPKRGTGLEDPIVAPPRLGHASRSAPTSSFPRTALERTSGAPVSRVGSASQPR